MYIGLIIIALKFFHPLTSCIIIISYTCVFCNLMNVLYSNFIAGGQLKFSHMMPFNEGANGAIICINQNHYFRGTPQWKTPDGSNIGTMGTRNFSATLVITGVTRHQAGTYTCIVPGVPEVPVAKFDLIVNCKLQ